MITCVSIRLEDKLETTAEEWNKLKCYVADLEVINVNLQNELRDMAISVVFQRKTIRRYELLLETECASARRWLTKVEKWKVKHENKSGIKIKGPNRIGSLNSKTGVYNAYSTGDIFTAARGKNGGRLDVQPGRR